MHTTINKAIAAALLAFLGAYLGLDHDLLTSTLASLGLGGTVWAVPNKTT